MQKEAEGGRTYICCAESHVLRGGSTFDLIICMTPMMSSWLMHAVRFSIDTSFKRLHSCISKTLELYSSPQLSTALHSSHSSPRRQSDLLMWQEFEIESWDHQHMRCKYSSMIFECDTNFLQLLYQHEPSQRHSLLRHISYFLGVYLRLHRTTQSCLSGFATSMDVALKQW